MAGKQQLKFIAIQAIGVENTMHTQCNAIIFGLDSNGNVWTKTDRDELWRPECMLSNGTTHQQQHELINQIHDRAKNQDG